MSLNLQKQRPEGGETNVAIWKCDRASMRNRDKLSMGGRTGWCDCTGLPRGVEAEAKGLVLVGICNHGGGGVPVFPVSTARSEGWFCQPHTYIYTVLIAHRVSEKTDKDNKGAEADRHGKTCILQRKAQGREEVLPDSCSWWIALRDICPKDI